MPRAGSARSSHRWAPRQARPGSGQSHGGVRTSLLGSTAGLGQTPPPGPRFPCGSRTGWLGVLQGQQSVDTGSSGLPTYVSGPKNNLRGGATVSSCNCARHRMRAELCLQIRQSRKPGRPLASASSCAAPVPSPVGAAPAPWGHWPGAEPGGRPEPTWGQQVLGSQNLDVMVPKIY